ncbi:MAG TPA: patatin-like phospholipase family protein [Frateuria sp.]|uniref:patatin-like phospholipase family protein n=1 Tax=Frateuria sp. TaxID=2211372 RepID=UPI002DF35635|nr:patatin-like phospholipase family protein [Frateuria sp.]
MRTRSLLLLLTLTLAGCAPWRKPPSAPAPPPRKLVIGLALGGGAAKGFAHIGVIKMLEASGIHPDVVTGTSAGSVVGALYASGMDAFAMQQAAIALDQASLRDVRLFSGGLVQGQKLQDYIDAQVGQRPIERLKLPFAAVATDLASGQRTVFTHGDTGQAVRASCSVPGVFEPALVGGRRYVDGGVVSPVPVDAARQLGADFVIAVDISARSDGSLPTDMLGIVGRSVVIMGQHLGAQELARADVVVQPQVNMIGAADFEQRDRAIMEGERAALAAIPLIRARLVAAQRMPAAVAAHQPTLGPHDSL